MAKDDYVWMLDSPELPEFFKENVIDPRSSEILLVSGVRSSPGSLARLAEESRRSGRKYSKIYALGNLFSPRGDFTPHESRVSRDELVLLTLAGADAIIIPGSDELMWKRNFSEEGLHLLESLSGNYSASPTKGTRCYFASPGKGVNSRRVPTVPECYIGARFGDPERRAEGVRYKYVTVEDALEGARKEGLSAIFTGAKWYSPEFRYAGVQGKWSRKVEEGLSEKGPLKLPLNPETPLFAEIPDLASGGYDGLGSYGVLIAPGKEEERLEIVSFKPFYIQERSMT